MSPATTCGAKTRAGSPCRRAPATGRSRCRLHGGATPRGAASPHWRHGRYCRALQDLRREWPAIIGRRQRELEAERRGTHAALLEDLAVRVAELETALFGAPRAVFDLTPAPGEVAAGAARTARRELDRLLLGGDAERHGNPMKAPPAGKPLKTEGRAAGP